MKPQANRKEKDMSDLNDAIKRFEGFVGEVHERNELYVANWKFSLRMRKDQGEISEHEYSDALSALEEVERIWLAMIEAGLTPQPELLYTSHPLYEQKG